MADEDGEGGEVSSGLDELARRLADGEVIDWPRERARAADEKARREIEALAGIAQLADAHRTFLEGAGQAAPPRPRPGVAVGTFGDLDLLEKVGEGASAEVYRAWDRRLEREVAVKLVRTAPSGGQSRGAAALAEGRLLARLRHENVARVFRAEERDGVVGIEMEFVRGRTLAQLVAERGPFGAREATLVGMDLCRALAAVHGAGLLHRDLKAQNVLREEGGRILLVDFGIGQEAAPTTEPGARHTVTGTPLYLAPELFAGVAPSVASDLYSLGVLLYFLATGRFPIAAKNLEQIREAQREGRATPLREARADLPSAFVRAVERALERQPEARFASAAAMETALAEVLGAGETTQILLPATLAGRRRRRRLLAAAAALPLVIAASFGVAALRRQRDAERFESLLAAAAEQRSHGELRAALALYAEAQRYRPEDPRTFVEMSSCQAGAGLYDQAIASSEEAFRRVQHLEGALRHKVEGNLLLSHLDYAGAFEKLRDAVTLDPSDLTSRRRLAMVSAYLMLPAQAVAEMQKVVAARPDDILDVGELAILETLAGEPDAALTTLAQIRERARARSEREPDSLRYLFWGEGLAWLGKGDLGAAASAFRELNRGGEELRTQAAFYLAQPALLDGRLYDALSALEAGFAADRQGQSDGSLWKRRLWVAHLWWLAGEREHAAAELDRFREVPQHPIFLKALRGAALLEIELGRSARARTLLQRIEALRALRPGTVSVAAASAVAGALNAAEGDAATARSELKEAARVWSDPVNLFELGRFLRQTGACREAVPVLRELLAQQGLIFEDSMASLFKLGQLELARCQAELARPAEAAEAYRAFLAGWATNAPEAPAVVAARREEGELRHKASSALRRNS